MTYLVLRIQFGRQWRLGLLDCMKISLGSVRRHPCRRSIGDATLCFLWMLVRIDFGEVDEVLNRKSSVPDPLFMWSARNLKFRHAPGHLPRRMYSELSRLKTVRSGVPSKAWLYGKNTVDSAASRVLTRGPFFQGNSRTTSK